MVDGYECCYHFRLLEHGDDADIDEPITIDESQMREFGLGAGVEEDGSVVQQQSTMTPTEKAAAVAALKAKIAAKRAEKSKAEEADEVEKERQRREMGQKSTQTHQERKEAQERLEAARVKRQKEEEKAYLASLKEKVRLEREERAAKASGAATVAVAAAPTAAPSTAPVVVTHAPQPEYTECQLQIRLTNGQQLKHNFLPTNTISEVIDWITQHRTDGFASFILMTNFPKVVFDTAEKRNMTLLEAKLVPRGVLVVTKQ